MKHLALLDVDNTLVFADSTLNQNLLHTLIKFGIKDICLFTSMGAKTLLSEDQSSLTRYQLVQELKKQGFIVHAVVTPIDPIYNQESGRPYTDLLEPQYERRLNDPNVSKMPLENFRQDLEYRITRLQWDYYNILMDLVNNLITGEITSDSRAIEYLQNLVKDQQSSIGKLQIDFPNMTTANMDKIQSTDTALTAMAEHLNNMNTLATANNSKGIVDYILEIAWVKKLPWISKLNLENTVYDPWNKGSMYASVTQNPSLSDFDNYVFFDDKESCLKTVQNLHPVLNTEKTLHCVKVRPQKGDEKIYYEKSLLSKNLVLNITEVNEAIENVYDQLIRYQNKLHTEHHLFLSSGKAEITPKKDSIDALVALFTAHYKPLLNQPFKPKKYEETINFVISLKEFFDKNKELVPNLEMRRRRDRNPILQKLVGAILDLISLMSSNKIATVEGRNITRSFGSLFAKISTSTSETTPTPPNVTNITKKTP